ncbi:MAG: glycine cleavage system protein GcvH [Oscillospiraceae bacterium]
MTTPENLKYTKSHEWVSKLENGNWQVGLTDFAQSSMGDIVFVNLPEEGDEAALGQGIAEVESVKTVSDVYSPIAGTVAAVNGALADTPEQINESAYEAWLFEITPSGETEELLDAAAYTAYCELEG